MPDKAYYIIIVLSSKAQQDIWCPLCMGVRAWIIIVCCCMGKNNASLKKRLGIKRDRRPDDGKHGSDLGRFFMGLARHGSMSFTQMAKGQQLPRMYDALAKKPKDLRG